MAHRISEKILNETQSLEELVEKMGTTKDGRKLSGMDDTQDFLNRFQMFKEMLQRELPDFTTEEILKVVNNIRNIMKIREWYNADYFLDCLEFEIRKNGNQEN